MVQDVPRGDDAPLVPKPCGTVRNSLPDLAPALAAARPWLGDEAFYYPGMLGAATDRSVFDNLMAELDFQSCWLNTGMKFARTICLGSDEVLSRAPTYRAIVENLAEFFDVRVIRSLANCYRDGNDWCNLHSDQYNQGNYPIDLTVGVTFGDERELVFVEKAEPKHCIRVPQRNGDVFAFSDVVNRAWRHMVPRGGPCVGPRISIIVWCTRQPQADEPAERVSSLGSFPHMLHHDPGSGKGAGRAPRWAGGSRSGGKGKGKGKGRGRGRGEAGTLPGDGH